MVDAAELGSLGDVVRAQARARGEAVAFSFEGRNTSFAEFDRHTNQVANGLTALGVGNGDRIAYLGKNTDRYFEALFGAAKAGAIMAPINWRLAPPEVRYIVGDAAAKVLFVGPEFIDQARELLPELSTVRHVIAVEGGAPDWPDFQTWRDSQPDADPAVRVDYEDIAIQLYTSGTTGHPKGAMLSHRALLKPRAAQLAADTAWNRWSADDVSLVAMPVFHIGGTGWGIMGLYNGAKGVIAREFDPMRVLDFIENDRISKMFMVPAAMQIVVRQPRAREVDFSCLKYLLYGASPIPLDLLKECMEVFGCGFVQMYGMTETTGTIVALPPEDHDPKGNPRMRSAGKPLPGVEIAILSEDGRRLGPHEVGEIATRSAANMSGYWNLPDATARTIDSEGWLRTGDAGYLDEDGYVYIHDRVKDMIISGGENVYPAEVENAIFGHPAVADVAVIGVPDERWGEAVKAVVVRKPGADPSPTEIIAWARERIAGYKAPKSIDFIDALPRNPSGKILRRELREPYWAGIERRVN
ncbi:fatty acid--CoA ligase [Phenylobacterium montanum]|uniref:3-methylmercaptopropionyl-CoA ligase n=1 Tax=Phenylobacterium montanum TaxID=2823693 RepID=A0A975IXD1_9CAUL|nr:fatty acid--CoA ligase [Caulobacter sp. S6]QUD90509.1 fatty acid--CoA ligase [Caulobacter sp. S6]